MEKHASVKRATVIAKNINDSMTLIAYYIGEKTDQLHTHLRSLLPSYMVPSIIIWLPRFPETLNGKIDNNKLPDPQKDEDIEYVSSGSYLEPRNELEKVGFRSSTRRRLSLASRIA